MTISDFRSDTVTLPTPAMREAMACAEVGDDVLDGDPTVRELERRAADWLGKQGAIFVPSGTMANQVALGAWTRPGEEMIVEFSSHIVCWEAGAAAALHGVQAVTLRAEDGALGVEDVLSAIRTLPTHTPRTALLCTEQTFTGAGNAAGGRVVPLEHLRELRDRVRERGLRVHMDGARIGNAAAAAGIPASVFAATADSVSACLSKGLGAPVGSVIAGDEEFLARGRRVRQMLGGWMRQAGILASAGLIALEQGLARLGEDHALARAVAAALDPIEGLSCPPQEVDTNIVMVQVRHRKLAAEALARALEERGVRTLAWAPDCLRLVTHRDVGPADVDRLEQAAVAVLA